MQLLSSLLVVYVDIKSNIYFESNWAVLQTARLAQLRAIVPKHIILGFNSSNIVFLIFLLLTIH